MNIVSVTMYRCIWYIYSFFTDADELCFTLYLALCLHCTSVKDPWHDPHGTSSITSSKVQQDDCFVLISLMSLFVNPTESREKGMDSEQCWVPTRTL